MLLAPTSVLLGLLAVTVVGVAPPQKPIVVSYADDTPINILHEAEQKIRDAGGIITHEFQLIKAFAAKAPAEVLDTVRSMGKSWDAYVEEEQVYSVNEDESGNANPVR
ncbi:MAG: hypothetical protein M1833_000233 [Piccolia ochrophora]|nr:MAG: hypothetical protein M1833_000233 [Piccolia ochrophora]